MGEIGCYISAVKNRIRSTSTLAAVIHIEQFY